MDITPGNRLRRLIDQPSALVVPGIYDCLTARLAEQAGFEAAFTSGFGISASLLGRPDFGFLTATEVLNALGRMTTAVSIPVVADLDTGYGSPLNVFSTVSEAVRLGAAGVILEDQEWPKKCGHFEGKRVIPCRAHVAKIHAAVEARGDSGLVIVGRTDARASHGLEEAIARGRAYREAGADVVFIEAPRSVQELQKIAEAFPDVPTFANIIEGGKTPPLSASDLEALGFSIVVFPLLGLFSSAAAVGDAFRVLQERRALPSNPGLDFRRFAEVIGLEDVVAMEKRFSEVDDE